MVDETEGAQLFQREVDALLAYMAAKEQADFIPGQASGAGVESLTDALSRGIDGRDVEEEAGAGQAVIPDGQGGVEMAGLDDGAGIEGRVEGAEAQDLGLSAAGGGAVDVGMALAQGRIAIIP